jgi:hypothetical protein
MFNDKLNMFHVEHWMDMRHVEGMLDMVVELSGISG